MPPVAYSLTCCPWQIVILPGTFISPCTVPISILLAAGAVITVIVIWALIGTVVPFGDINSVFNPIPFKYSGLL